MALVEWTSEYSVEIESIDAQHKQLFEMINELYDAMRAGNVALFVPAILKRLATYCREHFAEEEGMMIRTDYPDYLRHRAEHIKLTKEVMTMERDFTENKVVRSLTLLTFLKDWIQRHILFLDKQYGAHLKAAGVMVEKEPAAQPSPKRPGLSGCRAGEAPYHGPTFTPRHRSPMGQVCSG